MTRSNVDPRAPLTRHGHSDFKMWMMLVLHVGRLTSQQPASVSRGRICSDNSMCCHTEIEFVDQLSTSSSHSIRTLAQLVSSLTVSRQEQGREDTGVPFFYANGMVPPGKSSTGKTGSEPWSAAFEAGTLPLGHRGCPSPSKPEDCESQNRDEAGKNTGYPPLALTVGISIYNSITLRCAPV